ncbi:MAG: hypothetical protein QOJ63_2914 [Solirubrobacteraceae bacterium]|nr:hypothetical protein [Solirubrobacteraceae bacterium]
MEIPPPPRRGLALATVLLAAAVVAVLTLVAPAIDRSKERDAARRERDATAGARARRAQLAFDQRAHHARAPEVGRMYAADREAASRAALRADVRASIDRDVRARVAAGELRGPISAVRCRYRARERGVRVHLDCLAVTAGGRHRRVLGYLLGHPFVVGASLRDGRYAWCKDNPRPGERAIGRSVTVALPAACSE